MGGRGEGREGAGTKALLGTADRAVAAEERRRERVCYESLQRWERDGVWEGWRRVGGVSLV